MRPTQLEEQLKTLPASPGVYLFKDEQGAEKIQKFAPPAFELSRHYLESLQELENKKKKKTRKKS